MAKKIKIFMALFFLGGGQFVPLGTTIRQKKKKKYGGAMYVIVCI